jgi:aryl-phospho-beta-D-glucosidase BglC (GH1 family)
MGWRHDAAAGIVHTPRAVANSVIAQSNFSVPFEVSARDGEIWIRHRGRNCTTTAASSCYWTDWQPENRLLIKGVSWTGFEQADTNCPEQLQGYRDHIPVSTYTDILQQYNFNAVRLPLYARGVVNDPELNINRCGKLGKNLGHSPPNHYNRVLLRVVRILAEKGQYVMLDMHTLDGGKNTPTWCGEAECTEANESILRDAWLKLAHDLCNESNVILTDLYNEPFGSSWRAWKATAERIGDAILTRCPRWLIGVQGIGSGDGECLRYAGTACWWGENLLGHLEHPVQLAMPSRLVLLPHTYGHDETRSYMRSPDFPRNMPTVWNSLWGRLPRETGSPTIVGEWGGRMGGKSELWQRELQRYLREMRMSSFFFALNANSRRVGGIYPLSMDHGEETLQMLSTSPVTTVVSLQTWALCRPPATPPQPPPPTSPPAEPNPPLLPPPPLMPPSAPPAPSAPPPAPFAPPRTPPVPPWSPSPPNEPPGCAPSCTRISAVRGWTIPCLYNTHCATCSACEPPPPQLPPPPLSPPPLLPPPFSPPNMPPPHCPPYAPPLPLLPPLGPTGIFGVISSKVELSVGLVAFGIGSLISAILGTLWLRTCGRHHSHTQPATSGCSSTPGARPGRIPTPTAAVLRLQAEWRRRRANRRARWKSGTQSSSGTRYNPMPDVVVEMSVEDLD